MDEIKNKVKAIIFDMDGTIVDTERAWRNVTLDVLKYRGIDKLTSDQEKFLETLLIWSDSECEVELEAFYCLPSYPFPSVFSALLLPGYAGEKTPDWCLFEASAGKSSCLKIYQLYLLVQENLLKTVHSWIS